jgi:hypothetical protein
MSATLNNHSTRSTVPGTVAISDEEMRLFAPSVFASQPIEGASEKYRFLPTSSILNGMRANGWVPVRAQEQSIRTEARRGFQKHIVRFARLQHLQNWEKNQVRPEVVLVNHFKSKDELAAEAIASGLDVAANDLSGVVRVSTQRTARSCYQTDTVRFVLLASKTACEILSVLSPIAPSISKVDPVVIDSKKCRFSRTYD